ncbi:MAG: hypothetical protein JJU02_04070 [Cryomorphaceae bacterium]|nr:hypothetical protein [Cryomorphaceae bacterium]
MSATKNPILAFILLVFLLLTIFPGCSSDDKLVPITTKVHGHLKIRGTGDIINDKSYKIGFGPSNVLQESQMYEVAYTDADGYFEFSHEAIMGETDVRSQLYSLRFLDEVPDQTFYFPSDLIFNTNNIPGEENTFSMGYQGEANLYLTKKAWLELVVKRSGSQTPSFLNVRFGGYNISLSTNQNLKVVLPGMGNWLNRIDFFQHNEQGKYVNTPEYIQLGEMDTTHLTLEF